MQKERTLSLDWIRVVACLLVLVQHVCEFYYVSPDFLPARTHDSWLIGWFNSISRASVPLFVLLSGYLLLPMRQPLSAFFRRRFTRILFPLLIWSVGYALYGFFLKSGGVEQLLHDVVWIPVNFNYGHLWYVYMLVGLYLLIPILSPWLQQVSRRELEGYLLLWLFTTLIPYIHQLFPEVLGEAFWNDTPMLHYFSGFVGYLLLGYYLRRYGVFSVGSSLIAIVVGWVATSLIFQYQLSHCETLPELELSWGFNTLNVVLMTVGLFSLLHRLERPRQGVGYHLLTSISQHSYGIYLCHMMWLECYMQLLRPYFGSVIAIVLPAVLCTLVSAWLTILLLKRIPRIGKYFY